jgi:CNT family concentrative nucleoside transporter
MEVATEDTSRVGRQAWTREDALPLGGLALVAAASMALEWAGMSRVQSVAGLAVLLALAYCLSSARRAIDYRTVAWGLGLQFVFALIVLKTGAGRAAFQAAGAAVTRLLGFASVGSSFVFGPLGDPAVWPRIMTAVLGAEGAQYATIFAFQVLPTIIFIAALFAMLYYFGVMPLIVRAFAVGMRRFMRASGAETLNVAASVFMGQTEAPLTIRPFLPRMTESELMTVMTAGMAHISGGIMAAYILFGIEAQHLLTAVIMTAPGTLMMAKLFVPETRVPETMGTVRLEIERTDVNVIDAVGRGTGEGLQLALNVAAMLISFLALIALVNAGLGLLGSAVGVDLSMQRIFGANSGRSRTRSIRARSRLPPLRCAGSRISARLGFKSAALARWRPSVVTTSLAWVFERCSPARSPTS